MKNFSPRPRSIRERNIKMCNRSASLCCCCCHHFCRFRIIFRQQECWGLLGESWTMAVYSNWNSSTSFHDKNWDSCKVILHNCWDDDELEVMKPCPEYFEWALRKNQESGYFRPGLWLDKLCSKLQAWRQALLQASAPVPMTFRFFLHEPNFCGKQNTTLNSRWQTFNSLATRQTTLLWL